MGRIMFSGPGKHGSDVVGAIELSRATYRKMVQNLVWATARKERERDGCLMCTLM